MENNLKISKKQEEKLQKRYQLTKREAVLKTEKNKSLFAQMVSGKLKKNTE